MLHVCVYIERHGCPMNYNGSRGDFFGKPKIKDSILLTNKQKDALNFDIGQRILEDDVIDQASTFYLHNKGYWHHNFVTI